MGIVRVFDCVETAVRLFLKEVIDAEKRGVRMLDVSATLEDDREQPIGRVLAGDADAVGRRPPVRPTGTLD